MSWVKNARYFEGRLYSRLAFASTRVWKANGGGLPRVFTPCTVQRMSKKRTVKRTAWKILVILVALGTIAYLALPFLGF